MSQSLSIIHPAKKSRKGIYIVGGILVVVAGAWLYMRYIYQPTITLDLSDQDWDAKTIKYKVSLNGKTEVEGTATLGVSSGAASGKYKLTIESKDKKIVFSVYKQNGQLAVTKTADFQLKK